MQSPQVLNLMDVFVFSTSVKFATRRLLLHAVCRKCQISQSSPVCLQTQFYSYSALTHALGGRALHRAAGKLTALHRLDAVAKFTEAK